MDKLLIEGMFLSINRVETRSLLQLIRRIGDTIYMIQPDQGLYDQRTEHDACGVGFIANIDGSRAAGPPIKLMNT